MPRHSSFARAAALCLTTTFALACSGGEAATHDTSHSAAPGAAASAASGWGAELTPDAGGQVHTVQMLTDGSGNRFEPAELTVKRGDVVRYVLQSGVHNVRFVADSSPSIVGMPGAASDYLQLPGQAVDMKVGGTPGAYFFQCDPHAALGMVGRVRVE